MPVERKPLFRPDVLRPRLKSFDVPQAALDRREALVRWAALLASPEADQRKEQELLADFLNDVFVGLLGYTRPADDPQRSTISREQHVQAHGKFADAVLGEFTPDQRRYVVALEGKGPTDPLDVPHKNRKHSAVEQAYGYAINLPCDWIIVTSMRETRLYCKGTDQATYEVFELDKLATNDHLFRKFVYLLAAERVVPDKGRCHLDLLREASDKAGRDLTREFYQWYAAMREDVYEQLCAHNPQHDRHTVLSATQHLLDRVLFCAFCEDRGLLPENTLKDAFAHRDKYNPRPVWENFKSLFRFIDEGHDRDPKIPRYNGGLFALDPVVDGLIVPDSLCKHFFDLGDYEYRMAAEVADEPASEDDADQRPLVDVDILGHIFEQSISDLEQIRNELDGLVEPQGKEKHKTRRKKEGAFYTPAFITRYIVEQTLGKTLAERFESLRACLAPSRLAPSHRDAGPPPRLSKSASAALADPRVYDIDTLKKPQRDALIAFWEAWQDELATIRVLDPACGSGAFLIEAFDRLHAEYRQTNDRLTELHNRQLGLFYPDARILQSNLYGVDLNEEAIQICRLSLWIKTARKDQVLTSLDHTIRVGNSVVDDPAVHPLAFDWSSAFPEVTAAGGFDVVIGNPPYIRQEWLKAYKPHWERRFPQAYAGTADIYTYFYVCGLERLRPGGQLAFISSNAFARANYAKPLREYLAGGGFLQQFIDLGDTQVFEDAKDVYPAIVVLKRSPTDGAAAESSVTTIRLRRSDDPALITELVKSNAWAVPLETLDSDGWRLDSPEIVSLRDKLEETADKLADRGNDRCLRGLITGLNEAFVVSDARHAELIANHPTSTTVLHELVGGQDLRRWYPENSGQWLILLPNGVTTERSGAKLETEGFRWLSETYPAIAAHLEPFAAKARKRLDKGQFWWELRPCDYYDAFARPKIMYPDIAKSNRFHMDDGRLYSTNTTYFLPTDDWYLLAVLNSRAIWFALSGISIPFGERAGEFRYRLFSQYIERLPIPAASEEERIALAGLARKSTESAKARYSLDSAVQDRLIRTFGESSSGELSGSLNNKAQDWSSASLNQLGAALKTSFKLKDNPFKNPSLADVWEPYLAEKKAEHDRLSRDLAAAEAELNDRVYRLFHLTPDEIALLQREVEH